MTDEAYKNLCALANDLVQARPEEVEAEGAANFIQYCERAMTSFKEAGMRNGRGLLMIELGMKINAVREGPEAISAGLKQLAHSTPKKSREKSRPPAEKDSDRGSMSCPSCHGVESHALFCRERLKLKPNPDPHGQASALPIPGQNPNDPDDAEW